MVRLAIWLVCFAVGLSLVGYRYYRYNLTRLAPAIVDDDWPSRVGWIAENYPMSASGEEWGLTCKEYVDGEWK